MIDIKGKYENAIVYNDNADSKALSQVRELLNQPMAHGSNVRVMPDIHAGTGCVIGYTAKLTDKVVPNLIGVDIGCGVLAVKMKDKVNLAEFNNHIKKTIPVGRNTHTSYTKMLTIKQAIDIKLSCQNTRQDYDYVRKSIGTLGGGNHFLEIDEDINGDWWFLIHSGSRNFGLKIANFFQKLAQKCDYKKEMIETIKTKYSGSDIEKHINLIPKRQKGLEWLEGNDLEWYLDHMQIAQEYAQTNRKTIAELALGYENESIESVHNYIDLDSRIIRKGAISAKCNEKVLIPLNMRDGVLIGIGKGNDNWNFSAPHGAGRLMSRSDAKKRLSIEEFREQMSGIYSTCINESTLDEAPMAYKDALEIKQYIEPTVDIVDHMKPIWNYKG